VTLLEPIAAAIIGLALLWLVLQPILAPGTTRTGELDFPDPEETPRGQALLALKEIEFDRATGKLSDSDYSALHTHYTVVAVAALEPRQTTHCLIHGDCDLTEAAFCPICGAGLVTNDGLCVGCGRPLPTDAAFCPGCGTAVRPVG
jgi:hypothetical protein